MEYEGYLTREDVLDRIERAFPFIERPSESDLYVFDESDMMRKIIHTNLSNYLEPELPYEGVMLLYDEFSTISNKAVEWIFPSLLRIILKKRDASSNLSRCLPTYFNNMSLDIDGSAYDFSWLTNIQILALNCMLEYLSEECSESIGLAQEKLRILAKNITKRVS